MFGKKSKIALACAGIAALAAPVVAQDYQAQVQRLLNATQSLANAQGYSSTHSRYEGSLREGQERTVTLDLDAGTSYMIVAQCDTDCSDIDMWLYDENSNLIDSDVLVDDTPIVNVTPRRNARFSLRTRMISCSVEPCFYGIGAYGR